MATYKKRGYKPSNKEEDANRAEEESTTAEVFNTLDEGANKTEAWVAKNQSYIFIIVGLAIVGVLGYLGYQEYIQKPKEAEAANLMATSQQYFGEALQASSQSDSLYNLSLMGTGNNPGFLNIIENYGSTNAGNNARYFAGMALLNTGKYKEAIEHLDNFDGDDEIVGPLAKGAIGDAFMQLEPPQLEEALDYYEQAAKMRTNDFTTPRFLLKAAVVALDLGQGEKAEKHLRRIEDEFASSPQAEKIDIYLGQAQVMQ